ncbi:MAG TPA: phosphotransferase [Paracoccaceae bacterium]|nr:phosphotransferase [Paracoccaceae bacterium]
MSAHAAAQIDVETLAPYLEAEVPGLKGLKAAVKFSDGQSNPTFRLDADSGSYVLRAKPPGELLKSAHQVDREHRVMAALAETDVPVPRMLHMADEGNPLGRMFYVMEYKEGRVLWDPALPDYEPAERAAIYDEMNRVLAALHDVDHEAVGLGDFGRPGSYYARQFNRWSKQYKASETEPSPKMDALAAWLEANMPEDDGVSSLVHGDYRLDNVMFHPTEPRIIAVLDWELSTIGHPIAELAYQCMNWRLPYKGGFRGLGDLERSAATGLPAEKDYVAKYCERRGLSDVPHWDFAIVFNFHRMAAILQGVYKRALDGNASNPEKARTYGEAVPKIADIATDYLEKAT